MIGIGIGCRSGARKEAILDIIAEALARTAPIGKAKMLFTFIGRKDEEGLAAAAADLGLPLVFLSREELKSVADKIATRSEAAEKALGIASVAEAAALAGCGPGAHLLLPRIAGDGVTCAIAQGDGR